MAPQASVVGRSVEGQRLARVLRAAAQGDPGVVFIHGEAGVGKTALVREVCEHFDGAVLWGTCVHFGAASVPFAALIPALDGWVAAVDRAVRDDVFAGLDVLSSLLPSLGSGAPGERGLALPQIDTALVRLARRCPTALVIDDLQWADASSLDLLAFLISGFRDQRLAVLATVRDEDRPEGHPLTSWLGEVRRMPAVEEIHLERLGPDGTAAQVAALTGEAMSPAQVSRVHSRSGGNPYLTELLVCVAGSDSAEPSGSPSAALREALLSRWHSLSGTARQSTRLLALGGRPVTLDVLQTVGRLVDPELADGGVVRDAVAEAVTAGILTRPVSKLVWFRHPLIAELLTGDVNAPDPAPVHSAYARALAGTSTFAPGDMASHHELAGEFAKAFEWSLIAADSAASTQGETERLEHLHRACRLWPQVMAGIEPVAKYVQLLLRTSMVCQGVNRPQEGLGLLEEALALTDRTTDPGMACRLLTLQHRMLMEAEHLSFGAMTQPLREAMALAVLVPATPEHVIVDVTSTWSELWSGRPGSTDRAEAALTAARQVGSSDALVPALTLMAAVYPESQHALGWATEAYGLAAAAGEVLHMADAAAEIHNQLSARGQNAAGIEADANHGRDVILAGAAPRGRFLLTCAAMFALSLGQWQQAEEYLRPALSAGDDGHRGADAHCVLAILSLRRGDQTRAERHLAWAAELSSTDYRGTASYPYAQVEQLLGSREPAQALTVIETQMGAALADPRDADELLLLAARAAADLAEQGRDNSRDDALETAGAALSRVYHARSAGQTRAFIPWGPTDRIQPARQALYAAEVGRLRGLPEQSNKWAQAKAACQQADMLWEQATAAFRQGQRALAEGLPRGHAAASLREAMTIAEKLGAQPLQQALTLSAQTSHLRLDPVVVEPWEQASAKTGLAELTSREREVLAHVAAGRSNSEIAQALFISDKTVSTHVSNILRKSQTSTRGEAAAWAGRLSTGD
ncbi:hypothetical protein ASC58_09975 [Phycicoccus sp. Root101]|nr:AAA family ATPase [Phycicoccus sp. Root101]KQU68966.1 hypothetical protein ASC58_09975 [Phycicoccus sp. Root101]